MNTLSSIRSLYRDQPQKAERLLDATAKELRIISRISAEKEIPLLQEIELCRLHLDVMGYRFEAEYGLVTENIFEQERVPPLIFHTLIENGLTHALKAKEDGTFWFSCEMDHGMIRYRLLNDGSLLKEFCQTHAAIEEGMGFKYVKARLEERYPGKWRIAYGMMGEKWQVVIEINK